MEQDRLAPTFRVLSEPTRLLAEEDFERAAVEPFRRYGLANLASLASAESLLSLEGAGLDGKVMGAIVTARKPGS